MSVLAKAGQNNVVKVVSCLRIPRKRKMWLKDVKKIRMARDLAQWCKRPPGKQVPVTPPPPIRMTNEEGGKDGPMLFSTKYWSDEKKMLGDILVFSKQVNF